MARPTRVAGSQEPFQIFRDDLLFDNAAPMMSHAPMPAVAKPPRRPLASANGNLVFNPPSSASIRQSPTKPATHNSKPTSAPSYMNKLGAVTMAPPMSKPPHTDSLQKKPYLSNFKTASQKPMFASAMQMPFSGKENMHPASFPMPPTVNFDAYVTPLQKGPGKRVLMDAAPITDARLSKKPRLDESGLPPHDSFPPIADDGQKPGHSYAQLIGMAILRSPNRRLTLAQIYKWISDTYKFYKAEEAGWQNSIRHNLSLHKAFIKVERPKDDPGKGNYWTIQVGMEMQFIKEKNGRKSGSASENLPVMSTRLEPSKPLMAPMPEPTLPPPAPVTHHKLPPLPTSQATLPAEISSDATIPVSDPAAPEDAERPTGSDAHADLSTYSPLPATMHSSPPVPRHIGSRSHTPPPAARGPPTSSINRSHKRNFNSMDDSGYISSLESSAMRPNQKSTLPTSEADRPRSKRSRPDHKGRAEVEIARLRASSYDSPSKGRSYNAFGPPSSSPFRVDGQMLPPLTPAMKLKPPQKPPPSASPNTNLQIHRNQVREMLQSPLRKMTGISEESAPWSPAFNLDTAFYDMNDPAMFGDMGLWDGIDDSLFDGGNVYESPCKKSAKRPRLDRAHTTTSVVEAGQPGNLLATPSLKLPAPTTITWDTPSKVFSGLDSSPSKPYSFQSPSKAPSPRKISSAMYDMSADTFFPGMFDSTDFASEETDGFNLDITQGFEKIGAGSQAKNTKKNTKPVLGRSYTTNF
ncbi:meiosis-specific transcription factor mei4 [Plectosphaerella cucumerina]|uniref:Meiosis-specific transcription factor mei4 n=1 Tax=Plectosphaerella cucumerina TaxID=40658 RepID=A0A8K0TES7_9PEZI|nr:meiosis-specific transcription factor mei4 [Plectosphaerella cucumerina]